MDLFGWIFKLIGKMLSFFSTNLGGYAVALFIYAILFKILFLPFSIKQQKNQIKMAKLQPQIELIKAKYKGRTDQPTMQKMQQEIMEFQQREGYSPFSGCLPMILQMIIIIPLYNVISNPLTHICEFTTENLATLREAFGLASNANEISIISQIQNPANKHIVDAINGAGEMSLDKVPDFSLFGLNLADVPSIINPSWLIVIPFIAAGLTWLSMFLTRKWNGNNNAMGAAQDAQANASLKIMDLVMPAITLFLAFSFSGMLGLYWAYQSALGILQTFIISRAMPLPKYTEEEIKEMRRAQKAAEKAQRTALRGQPKYRSLHYIDEEDYEELPELKTDENKDEKEEKKNAAGLEIPDIKD